MRAALGVPDASAAHLVGAVGPSHLVDLSPAAALVIDAAREAAWHPTANLSSSATYTARREAYDRLRALTRGTGWRRAFIDDPTLTALGFAIWRASRVDASNRTGERYYHRRQTMAELRACFAEWDRAAAA